MVRQEVRHGHFLAYCLDPHKPHGFGSECLKALMRAVARAQGDSAKDCITPLEVHLMDLENAQIRREWNKIDLIAILHEPKRVVAIELKIDSGEHGDQLQRYRKMVEEHWSEANGWKHLFVFLSKHGDEPSEKHGLGWITLDLDTLAQELDAVVQRQIGASDARLLLSSYLEMLRRHHLNNEELENLATKLWSQHRPALDFLLERRPNFDGGLLERLYEEREDIAKRMTDASGLKIIPDYRSTNIIRFAVEKWDGLADFNGVEGWTKSKRLMLLELAYASDKTALRMRFVLGPANQGVRQNYYEALVDGRALSKTRKKFSEKWTRLEHKGIKLGSYDDLDDAQAQALYEKVLKGIEDYAKEKIPVFDKALTDRFGSGI